jgi:hypothetical protein
MDKFADIPAAGEAYADQPFAHDDFQKWSPGLHELDAENVLNIITPPKHDRGDSYNRYKQVSTTIERELAAATAEGNGVERAIWQMAKLQMSQLQASSSDEDKAEHTKRFHLDFISWLMGKGRDADHERTPWGRDRLLPMFPSVKGYLMKFISRRFDKLYKLEMLHEFFPLGINRFDQDDGIVLEQAYLYFKYLVRADHAQEYWEDNEYEWDLWLSNSNFESAVQVNRERMLEEAKQLRQEETTLAKKKEAHDRIYRSLDALHPIRRNKETLPTQDEIIERTSRRIDPSWAFLLPNAPVALDSSLSDELRQLVREHRWEELNNRYKYVEERDLAFERLKKDRLLTPAELDLMLENRGQLNAFPDILRGDPETARETIKNYVNTRSETDDLRDAVFAHINSGNVDEEVLADAMEELVKKELEIREFEAKHPDIQHMVDDFPLPNEMGKLLDMLGLDPRERNTFITHYNTLNAELSAHRIGPLVDEAVAYFHDALTKVYEGEELRKAADVVFDRVVEHPFMKAYLRFTEDTQIAKTTSEFLNDYIKGGKNQVLGWLNDPDTDDPEPRNTPELFAYLTAAVGNSVAARIQQTKKHPTFKQARATVDWLVMKLGQTDGEEREKYNQMARELTEDFQAYRLDNVAEEYQKGLYDALWKGEVDKLDTARNAASIPIKGIRLPQAYLDSLGSVVEMRKEILAYEPLPVYNSAKTQLITPPNHFAVRMAQDPTDSNIASMYRDLVKKRANDQAIKEMIEHYERLTGEDKNISRADKTHAGNALLAAQKRHKNLLKALSTVGLDDPEYSGYNIPQLEHIVKLSTTWESLQLKLDGTELRREISSPEKEETVKEYKARVIGEVGRGIYELWYGKDNIKDSADGGWYVKEEADPLFEMSAATHEKLPHIEKLETAVTVYKQLVKQKAAQEKKAAAEREKQEALAAKQERDKVEEADRLDDLITSIQGTHPTTAFPLRIENETEEEYVRRALEELRETIDFPAHGVDDLALTNTRRITHLSSRLKEVAKFKKAQEKEAEKELQRQEKEAEKQAEARQKELDRKVAMRDKLVATHGLDFPPFEAEEDEKAYVQKVINANKEFANYLDEDRLGAASNIGQLTGFIKEIKTAQKLETKQQEKEEAKREELIARARDVGIFAYDAIFSPNNSNEDIERVVEGNETARELKIVIDKIGLGDFVDDVDLIYSPDEPLTSRVVLANIEQKIADIYQDNENILSILDDEAQTEFATKKEKLVARMKNGINNKREAADVLKMLVSASLEAEKLWRKGGSPMEVDGDDAMTERQQKGIRAMQKRLELRQANVDLTERKRRLDRSEKARKAQEKRQADQERRHKQEEAERRKKATKDQAAIDRWKKYSFIRHGALADEADPTEFEKMPPEQQEEALRQDQELLRKAQFAAKIMGAYSDEPMAKQRTHPGAKAQLHELNKAHAQLFGLPEPKEPQSIVEATATADKLYKDMENALHAAGHIGKPTRAEVETAIRQYHVVTDQRVGGLEAMVGLGDAIQAKFVERGIEGDLTGDAATDIAILAAHDRVERERARVQAQENARQQQREDASVARGEAIRREATEAGLLIGEHLEANISQETRERYNAANEQLDAAIRAKQEPAILNAYYQTLQALHREAIAESRKRDKEAAARARLREKNRPPARNEEDPEEVARRLGL